MNTTPQRLVFRLSTVAIALSFAVGLNSCTSNVQSQQPQPITIDGSSTVYPITQGVVQKFNNTTETPVDVSVGFSGTGGGFGKFCAGETDINNASRPIDTQEMEACKQAGVPYIEQKRATHSPTSTLQVGVKERQQLIIVALIFDIFSKYIKRSTASRNNTKSALPENRFPVVRLKFFGVVLPNLTTCYCLQGVTQNRDRHLGS